MAFRHLLLGSVLLAAVSPAWGDVIKVAVPPLANLLERDNSGVYQRLMDRAMVRLDTEIEQSFFPYRRSLKAFEERQVDCLVSLSTVLERRFGEEVVQSFPLGKFVFYVFTPADEPPIESLDELNGQVVGGITGHEVYLAPVLGDRIELEHVRSEEQAVRMLELDRLDAFVAAIPDMRPFLDELNYAPDHPLLESFDRINCHNTQRNRAFIRDLSRELEALKERGVYREEAGDLYVPF